MDIDQLIGVDDACKLLSIKRSNFYKMVRDGKLAAKKQGLKTFVRASELNRYIDTLPAMKAAA
jgi:excisionase family DNA binding protein